MGYVETDPAIATQQPTVHQFLHLCAETNIAKIPLAAEWGLQLLMEGDFHERWRITKVLGKVGDSILPQLLAIAENPAQDIELRWFAIRILGQYRQPDIIARLLVLIENCQEEFLADEIVRALVQLEEQATDYIVPLLHEVETRLLAVKALCKVRYSNIVEPLLSVVEDDNPEIRELAIEALGSFRHPRIFTFLLAALKDPASKVRIEAIRALGFWTNYADKDIIFQRVSPLLYDHNLDVCQQAGLALSRLQNADAVEAIATVIQATTTPLALKKELVQALGWIDQAASLQALGDILPQASEPLTLEIIKVIGRIDSGDRQEQGTKLLLDFWRQQTQLPKKDLRQAFVYALGQLKQPIAQETLRQLSHDADSAVRLHAIAALNKLPRTKT
ncbi:HEAT repeat domain-containing protein [[Limnothrix rosea] IAM M-220]|uniref:HEAT repeat domain-containing protein n=1 Tax=[Limnothrix rosea] IAM M-220 TaxID=454133 RepID=UPI00096807F7|nr:HEAT repeat domain-containing protein [[Limnothrix rosea] IAM M-220]OKH18344.1 PBS lyase [[Limnothrix rosea] IAM M-220]